MSLDKILKHRVLLKGLQVGAPAALKMAQFVTWSSLGHFSLCLLNLLHAPLSFTK